MILRDCITNLLTSDGRCGTMIEIIEQAKQALVAMSLLRQRSSGVEGLERFSLVGLIGGLRYLVNFGYFRGELTYVHKQLDNH